MRWTQEQYVEYLNRESKKHNHDIVGVCASNPKPIKGKSLERGISGEKAGGVRARIVFRIYSVRPADWDGYHVKSIQDCLRYAALLDGDDWNLLQGEVISEKVHTKSEERTEIEITSL